MKELELAKDAFVEYKNYPAEKAKAEKAHKLHIAGLRAQIAESNTTFKETWAQRKEAVRNNLDHAAMAAMQAGVTPNNLLAELGTRNPTWIYSLKHAGAEKLPELEDTGTHPLLKDVEWAHSQHTGTHGVLRSTSGLFKLYNLQLPEQWFIVDSSLELVTGSTAFYEGYSKPEIERLSNLLSSLLDNTYKGPVRLANNPYTS